MSMVLVICLVPHWLLSCHVVLNSVCSLVGSCHVKVKVAFMLPMDLFHISGFRHSWVNLKSSECTTYLFFAFPFAQIAK